MQGDQISNTSIYSEQIHISTNHNILEQIIQTFNFVISSSSNELWILFSFPSCLSVDHNLNLNFSLTQRDNILLVTFLNQSSTYWLLTSLSKLLHIRVRVTALLVGPLAAKNVTFFPHFGVNLC